MNDNAILELEALKMEARAIINYHCYDALVNISNSIRALKTGEKEDTK